MTKIINQIIKVIKNPKKLDKFFRYKLLSIYGKKTLGSGERYDPLIFKKIKLSDQTQEFRYEFIKPFINKEDTVLDISCGTGYGTKMISSECKMITGVDISLNAINFANKNYKTPNNNFIISDFFAYNNKSDIVISFETIEHIKADMDDILKKLISLAQKRIIISAPYMEKADVNQYHFHSKINEDCFKLMAQNGEIKFYYQTKDNVIEENKSNIVDIQNIIVIIDKKETI